MFPVCFHSVITNISLKLKVASNVFAIGSEYMCVSDNQSIAFPRYIII